jgi:hypothetical protein
MLDLATTVITGFFSVFISQRVYQENPNDIILALALLNFTIIWLNIDGFIRTTFFDEEGDSLWMDLWYYTLNFTSMTLMFVTVQYWLNIVKDLFDEVMIPIFEFVTISSTGIISLFYFFKLASLKKKRMHNFTLTCLKYCTKNVEFTALVEDRLDIKTMVASVKADMKAEKEAKFGH